jgi:hypothetical protein
MILRTLQLRAHAAEGVHEAHQAWRVYGKTLRLDHRLMLTFSAADDASTMQKCKEIRA